MNQNTYQISFRQQLLILLPLIIKNSLVLTICLFTFGWTIATFWVIALVSIIDILPTIILHVQYLCANWRLAITIDCDKKLLLFNRKGKVTEYSFSDTTKLIKMSSYGKGTGWYSFAEYRYYKIIFADTSEYILTCLLINKIEVNFKDKLSIEEQTNLKIIAFT